MEAQRSPTPHQWPSNSRAAIALTFDNMGEAADLNRGLWPTSAPIGSHYSVTQVLPRFLDLARKYDIPVTYFAESWSLHIYPQAVQSIADAGHEVAWHAWQHEAWAKECKSEGDEKGNFARSFGDEGIEGFLKEHGGSKVERYHGFRPPGGLIHGQRTLKLCRQYGLGYISPAAHRAALVPLEGEEDPMVVLPFRWSTVDAYYYMEAFGALRKIKGELPEESQGPEVLVNAYIRQIDETIEEGGFLSLLFHPFLNDSQDRLHAMELVLQHLSRRREEGQVWLARCKDIEVWVRDHPRSIGTDPFWDETSWR